MIGDALNAFIEFLNGIGMFRDMRKCYETPKSAFSRGLLFILFFMLIVGFLYAITDDLKKLTAIF